MQQETATAQIAAFRRSGRFFHATSVHQDMGGWYFHTREGVDYGPYLTVAEAQQYCGSYIRQCIANSIDGRRTQHQKTASIDNVERKSA